MYHLNTEHTHIVQHTHWSGHLLVRVYQCCLVGPPLAQLTTQNYCMYTHVYYNIECP